MWVTSFKIIMKFHLHGRSAAVSDGELGRPVKSIPCNIASQVIITAPRIKWTDIEMQSSNMSELAVSQRERGREHLGTHSTVLSKRQVYAGKKIAVLLTV